MRLTLTLAAASLAIASTACQRSASDGAGETAANDTMMTGNADEMAMSNGVGAANDMAGAAQSADTFVTQVAASDQYEIQSGRLAQTMASNAALKTFGGMLVTDHTKSSADLKTAAASAQPAITPPTTLPAEQQAKIDALKAAKGAEFDRLFLQQQKEGHQMTLDALKGYAQNGDQQSLKTFATKASTVVQRHLDELNGMKL